VQVNRLTFCHPLNALFQPFSVPTMGEKAGNNKVFKWMSYCEKALYAAIK
jgi:hypothetical protein